MKPPRPKVLITTSNTGGGHLSLSLALADALSGNYETAIVNPHPSIISQYYTWVGRHFLRLWGLSYKSSDNEKAASRLHSMLTVLIQKRLITLIRQIQPQLIITTHPLLSYEVARAVKQYGKRIPLIFQLCDLERVHSSWFTEKKTDAYLAPTQEIFAQAREHGIDESRLYITGMPLRKQFLQEGRTSRSETLASLKLDPAVFTVFLQGGAEGSAGIDQTVNNILASDKQVQIILAVGTNKHLASRFTGIANLRVLPFTKTIAPYIAAADVVIGKAGPNFIAEAAMLEKPFLATAFIPGQEAPNLAFLERYNLGWVCLEPEAQQRLISQLASDPPMIAEKITSIQAYRTWNTQANQNLYPLIERLVRHSAA